MPKNIIITPASGLVDFKDNSGISSATIQLDDSGNLNVSNPGGNLTIGNVDSYVKVVGGLKDNVNQVGTAGSILVSTGAGVSWTDPYAAGLQGLQGLSNQGVQGTQSAQGLQGDQGLQGLSNQGVQGTQGLQGLQGNQGLQGLIGTPVPWTVKTSNYTAIAKDQILTDTSGGSFTITLPATPSTGDYVRIGDSNDWFTNNLTVARNGSTIEGLSDDFLLDIKGILVEFVYSGTTWEVYSYAGPAGVQGLTGSSGTGGDILEVMLFA